MATFIFEGREFNALEGETVLDSLIRAGEKVTNSCKSGVCHSCMLKSTSKLDGNSQKGLSPNKKDAGFFLSCQQKASSDLEIFRPDTSTLFTDGKIISQERVSDSVVIVKIKPLNEYFFKAGQFTNIIRKDGVCRSYSIASETGDNELEFHIRKIEGGKISNWLYDEDLVNEVVTLSEPLGECSLTDEMEDLNLLLIGVGTGLAPLYGVLRDAIKGQKMEAVNLLHGGLSIESLYLVENLKELEDKYDFLNYQPVFLKGSEREGFTKGDLVETVRNLEFDKNNTVVMICGDPILVKKVKQEIFLAGVPSKKIFSDPFISH